MAVFCQRFYREKNGRPTILDHVQRSAFNAIQFGDNIEVIPFEHIRPHFYILMNWPRQFGKTYTISKAAATMSPIFDNFNIACYGPHDKRAKIMLAKIKMDLRCSELSHTVNWKIKNKEYMELFNGTNITSFNTSELQIRGDTEHIQLIDEADFIPDDSIILDSMEPKTLIPREQGWGRIFMISTPNMENEESVFKQWYFEALDSRKLFCRNCFAKAPLSAYYKHDIDESHFTVLKVPKVDNCACGSNNFVYYYDSEKMIIPVDPTTNPRIPWATLKARLDARGWSPKARQEYLGEIILGAGGMFPLSLIQKLERPIHNFKNPPAHWNPSNHETGCGLDYGKNHDNTVITISEKLENGRFRLLTMQAILSEVEHPTWPEISDTIMPIIEKWSPTYIAVDCTGVGSGEAEKVKHALEDSETIFLSNRKGHDGFYFDRKSKVDLISNMDNIIKELQLEIPTRWEPEMTELRSELVNFGFKSTQAGNLTYQAMRGKDDRVISLGLSLACFNENAFPYMNEYTWGFNNDLTNQWEPADGGGGTLSSAYTVKY